MSIKDTLWGSARKASEEEVIELTNQFYVTLRAYFAEIKDTADDATKQKEGFKRIQALLEPGDGKEVVQNWTNAYEIEQLFVHLYDDAMVATELTVRLSEARTVLRAELAAVYDAALRQIDTPVTPPTDEEKSALALRRRSLLARLVNDLQWRYISNEARRRYTKLITGRTAKASVVALMFFVGVVVIVAVSTPRQQVFTYGDQRLLLIASLAGVWGATFSMLTSLKSRLDQSKFDDLKLMKSFALLLSRAAIGAGAASILFFFLMSGLLGGAAFPELRDPALREPEGAAPQASAQTGSGAQPSSSTVKPPAATTTSVAPSTTTAAPTTTSVAASTTAAPPSSTTSVRPTTTTVPATTPTAPAATPNAGTTGSQAPPEVPKEARRLPVKDLALLIVWCFIAGFSEQLIPGLLASTEARAGVPAASGPGRSLPTSPAPVPPTGTPGPQGAGTNTGTQQQAAPVKDQVGQGAKPGGGT